LRLARDLDLGERGPTAQLGQFLCQTRQPLLSYGDFVALIGKVVDDISVCLARSSEAEFLVTQADVELCLGGDSTSGREAVD
jgi:hypothetical protein